MLNKVPSPIFNNYLDSNRKYAWNDGTSEASNSNGVSITGG